MIDATYKQVEYLGNELARLEAQMIDPREFGRLEGAVSSLKTELDQVKVDVRLLGEKVDLVLEKLSEAKGGWRLLLALGGAAASIGAAVAWAVGHNITVAPK